jgi:WD40 repeat protein
VGDFLLTANVGAHSISILKIDRPSGELTLIANVNSYGQKPVTISSTPVVGQPGAFWVAVGNQWDQPTVIYGGSKLERLPSDEFLQGDLTKPHPSDNDRTVELYRLDREGSLKHVRRLDYYPRENGGAAQISFSPDGKKLAVSTWGIPHFLTDDPKLEEMHPSRVYLYDFEDGAVSRRRHFEEAGISGSVGFEWGPRAEMLYVTNFSIVNAKGDNGLTVLKDERDRITKVAHYPTGRTDPKDIDEACWSSLSPKKDMLYVVSYVTNMITPFKLDPNSGEVIGRMPLITRDKGYAPPSDSKDVTISSDGRHMYWLGSFQSYSINLLDLESDGTATYRGQYTLAATKSAAGQPGVYEPWGYRPVRSQVTTARKKAPHSIAMRSQV